MLKWFSCEYFCRCASQKLDDDLAWYRIPHYLLHYCICLSCRRYNKQIEMLDSFAEHTCTIAREDEHEGLSEHKVEQIKKALLAQDT